MNDPQVNDRRIRNNLIEIWTGFEWVVQTKPNVPTTTGDQLMTKEHPITLKEALKLVSFTKNEDGEWHVKDVKGHVEGKVFGNVKGSVYEDVWGGVRGNVFGGVECEVTGNVGGTINGREWKFVETPRDKLKRLIEEANNAQLLEAFNQLEDN